MSLYTVKVEDSRVATGETPSAGPVYRCIYAKDGLMELPPGYESPWDFFRVGVKQVICENDVETNVNYLQEPCVGGDLFVLGNNGVREEKGRSGVYPSNLAQFWAWRISGQGVKVTGGFIGFRVCVK
ncbi:AMP-binding, conserved site-containing protein [Artemisia annua]|uniref:AMP-binding, conserved site-containing protein n=1 Tax=Artemisia annua TaxID=35608 RepID=A0A2U1LCK9_ARTAN|nr:AMP-binding, conserved site-containing protein [Artemisia annua]